MKKAVAVTAAAIACVVVVSLAGCDGTPVVPVTDLSPGIYSGTLSGTETTQEGEGEPVTKEVENIAMTVGIGASGLPVLGTKEVAVGDKVTDSSDSGSLTVTISDLTVSQNSVTVEYTVVGTVQLEGGGTAQMTGTGSWKYDLLDAQTIQYTSGGTITVAGQGAVSRDLTGPLTKQ